MMNSIRHSCGAVLMAVFLNFTWISTVYGGSHTWSGAVNGYWSVAGNWSSGGPPVAGESNLRLAFPAGAARLATTNNVGPLTIETLNVSGNNYTLAGGSALTFTDVLGNSVLCSGAGNVLQAPLILQGSVEIAVGAGDSLYLRNVVQGAGSLTKYGTGTLVLQAAGANTFSGGLRAYDGLIELQSGSTAVPGPLVIGDPAAANAFPTVRLAGNHQVADGASVTVFGNGTFECFGFDENLGSLHLIGGRVLVQAGFLGLQDSVNASGASFLSGPGWVNLNSGARAFNITNGTCTVSANLSDGTALNGGVLKNGSGTLALGSSNSLTGPVTIAEGEIFLQHANGLGGTTANTVVQAGASLRVTGSQTAFVGREPLGLAGTLVAGGPNIIWGGTIGVGGDAAVQVGGANTMVLSNGLSGLSGTLTKTGTGTLIFKGATANTFLGTTVVDEGKLVLAKQAGVRAVRHLAIGRSDAAGPQSAVQLGAPNQIDDTGSVVLTYPGQLDVAAHAETIGPLTLRAGRILGMSGLLTLGADVLVESPPVGLSVSRIETPVSLGGSDRVLDIAPNNFLNLERSISGAGLIKTGQGIVRLIGSGNSYQGLTWVKAGILTLEEGAVPGTAQAGTVVESGAALSLQRVSVQNEALTLNGFGLNGYGALAFSQTNQWSGPMTLASDTGFFSNATLADFLQVSGPIAGPGSLQFHLSGTVELAGANDNLYGGPTTVAHGSLRLHKPGGYTSVPGTLTIGASLAPSQEASVILDQSNQIANGGFVHVMPSGLLNLNGFDDGIGQLRLTAGHIKTDGGVLTLTGDVEVRAFFFGDYPVASTMAGVLSLGGTTRTIVMEEQSELSIYAKVLDGGAVAGIHQTGQGRLSLFGANSFTGEMRVQQGLLEVGHDLALGSTLSGTTIESGAELRLDGQHRRIDGESLILAGTGFNMNGALIAETYDATNLWTGPVQVAADASISVIWEGSCLQLAGEIAGPGSLEKHGPGTLQFVGTNATTLAGTLLVKSGTLSLARTNALAVSGPLIIGTTNGNSQGLVQYERDHQISDQTPVTVNRMGGLKLKDHFDGIGALQLNSGTVETGNGRLTLRGDVTVSNAGGPSQILGGLSLGGQQRTIHTGAAAVLFVDAEISDGGSSAGFTKTGSGSVRLQRSSTFTGPVAVEAGALQLEHDQALGASTGGVTVKSEALLALVSDLAIVGEAMDLAPDSTVFSARTNFWSGPVTLTGQPFLQVNSFDHDLFACSGPISGPGGWRIFGSGRVLFHGSSPNTFAGETVVEQGRLLLGKTNAVAVSGPLTIGLAAPNPSNGSVQLLADGQMASTSPVLLRRGGQPGLFDLNGFSATIGSLRGDGDVDAGAGTLTTGGNGEDTVFAGNILGHGPTTLIKTGPGIFTLTGSNTCTGATMVQGGHLIVNGSLAASAVSVSAGGSLGGVGTVASATLGGSVRPGSIVGPTSFGRLTSLGSLHLSPGSHYYCELGGMSAGEDCDQIRASGSVVLNQVILNLSEHFAAAVSNQFTILDIPIGGVAMGSFVGLPEGAQFTASPGRTFHITYQGGDGNDVVLTQLSVPQFAIMTGLVKSPLGPMLVRGQGSPFAAYELYAKDELNAGAWVNLGSVTADADGLLEYLDGESLVRPRRFYRFALP